MLGNNRLWFLVGLFMRIFIQFSISSFHDAEARLSESVGGGFSFEGLGIVASGV